MYISPSYSDWPTAQAIVHQPIRELGPLGPFWGYYSGQVITHTYLGLGVDAKLKPPS
jgi:hypothetical protein